MADLSLSTLHAATPQVSIAASSGAQVRVLRLLRHLDAAQSTRWLSVRVASDQLARTDRLFGARPLQASAESPVLADATTVQGLGRQTLRQHTVDGDATLALTDSTGRALWASNAQGTVHAHVYESASAGGRLVGVFERAAGGTNRQRERLHHGEPVAANRGRNLAGALVSHFDNAGVMHTHSLSLGGLALETRQRLLRAQASLPDWASSSEQALEEPLIMTHRLDAAGATLLQINAAGVSTRTVYGVSAAVEQTWMAQGAGETLVLKAVQRGADGVPLSQTAGNGVVDTYVYSARTRYLIRHRTARSSDHALGGLVISDLHYIYDPTGNILSLDDQGGVPAWHRNARADGLREYAYDTLYRLVSASGRERTPVAGAWSPAFSGSDRKGGNAWSRYTEHYTYDDGDNLTVLSHNGGAGSRSRKLVVSMQSNRALPEGHHLTAEAGFLPGGLQQALADGRPLCWQADNQLGQVSLVRRAEDDADTERYHYADGGARTRKVTTVKVAQGLQTTLVTYAGGCETRLRQLDGQLQKQVVITEVGSVRWVHTPQNGEFQLRYGFTDHLGSSGGETDALGRVVARQEYAPYGETTGNDEDAVEMANLLQRTLRYSGKELDATGLYYYGWRYHQPSLGRWLSADPAAMVDGPNLFAMVLGNPLRWVDEQGLMATPTGAQDSPSILGRMLGYVASLFRRFLGWFSTPPSLPSIPIAVSAPPRPAIKKPRKKEKQKQQFTDRDVLPVADPQSDQAFLEQWAARRGSAQSVASNDSMQSSHGARSGGTSRRSSITSISSFDSLRRHRETGKYALPADREFDVLARELYAESPNSKVILAIGKKPRETGKGHEFFYLAEGDARVGWKHVLTHKSEFLDLDGISTENDIQRLLMDALVFGRKAGVQNPSHPSGGRPIYKVNFHGNDHYVAISTFKDGGIIGANPSTAADAQRRQRRTANL